MSRATTKQELLDSAAAQFQKMWSLIDTMPIEEQEANFDFGDKYQGKEAHW